MHDAPFDDMDPAEVRLAGRVHDWLDQAVVPIDPGAIARRAAVPRSRVAVLSRGNRSWTRLAAGAAILALGLAGLLFVAGRSPSMVPAAPPSPSASPALPAYATPLAFTGQFQFTDCDGRAMDVNGELSARGAVCPIVMVEASDPRLLGQGEVRVDRDPHADGYALTMAAHRIENDGGAWQELPQLAIEHPGGPTSKRTITLLGEGGYTGLSVVAELSPGERVWELRGYIIEGEPAAPVASGPPME